MSRTPLLVVTFALAFNSTALWVHARASGVSGVGTHTRAADLYAPPVPSPTDSGKIDEYGNIYWRDERERLDNFAIELENDPTATGYIICYGGRVSYEGEATRRCKRARNYLGNKRHIGGDRIVTVDGGFREELTVELWRMYFGRHPPQSNPTVDPSEVKLIKRRPKRRR